MEFIVILFAPETAPQTVKHLQDASIHSILHMVSPPTVMHYQRHLEYCLVMWMQAIGSGFGHSPSLCIHTWMAE